jgi:hypothetical protein
MKTYNRKIAAQVAWIILCQVIMLACWTFVDKSPSHHLFLSAVVIAAWLLPVVSYSVVVYRTSLLAKWPAASRAGLFVFSSMVFTFCGYLVLGLAVDFVRELK